MDRRPLFHLRRSSGQKSGRRRHCPPIWGQTFLTKHFHKQLPVTLVFWLNTLTQGWSISVIYFMICCNFHFQQETKVWNSKFKQSFMLLIDLLVIFASWSRGYIAAMVTGPMATHPQTLRKEKLKLNWQTSEDFWNHKRLFLSSFTPLIITTSLFPIMLMVHQSSPG